MTLFVFSFLWSPECKRGCWDSRQAAVATQGEDREDTCLCVFLPANEPSILSFIFSQVTSHGTNKKTLAFLKVCDFTGALYASVFPWGRNNQEPFEPVQLILIPMHLFNPKSKYFLKYLLHVVGKAQCPQMLVWLLPSEQSCTRSAAEEERKADQWCLITLISRRVSQARIWGGQIYPASFIAYSQSFECSFFSA